MESFSSKNNKKQLIDMGSWINRIQTWKLFDINLCRVKIVVHERETVLLVGMIEKNLTSSSSVGGFFLKESGKKEDGHDQNLGTPGNWCQETVELLQHLPQRFAGMNSQQNQKQKVPKG